MNLTIKHRVCFENILQNNILKNLDSPEAWDILRNNNNYSSYTLPNSKKEWIKKCEDNKSARETARVILNLLKETKLDSITSLGVGVAYVEYHIKSLNPNVNLLISDFTKETINKLKSFFPEVNDIFMFDMLKDDYSKIAGANSLLLLNRVDTELNNKQWQEVFYKINKSDIQKILVIPTTFLNLKIIISELLHLGYWKLKKKQITSAGYLRTKSVFKKFWASYFYIEKEITHNNRTFLLLNKRQLYVEQ
jgi:hypothetical protein